MIHFYQFAWNRFNLKAKQAFWGILLASLLQNATLIIIPVVQKQLLEKLTKIGTESNCIFLYCVICVIGIVVMVIEAMWLNDLVIHLKRAIQE